MGNNLHGNTNEKSLSASLHNKKHKDLANLNLRTFIKEIHPTVTDDTLIQCPYNASMKKQDIQILIANKTYFISVKTGSGNSIHQEKLEPFIKILKESYSISDSLANDIRFFVWGDGTYDGSGLKENRLNASKIKKLYPNIINNIQSFFHQHKKELLTRFLVTGRFNGHIDYIYYGTPLSGVWCATQDALNFHNDYSAKSRGGIKLGNTTFQTWNRCIEGHKKENERDTIQLKWGAIQTDISNIRKTNITLNMGTQEGDSGEFNFCTELNRSKSNSNRYWKFLIENVNLPESLDNIYAVKVSNNVFSKLANMKVLPKTDLYLVQAELDPQFLLLNNHILDENLLNDKTFKIIPGSGISIKRPDSTKYTIQKLSVNSFNTLFGNTYLAAGASLYCNTKEINKNDAVISAWGLTYDELINSFPNVKKIGILNSTASIEEKVSICKTLKTYCNEQIKKLIQDDSSKSDLIFKGMGNFEEPYVAHFIFKNQTLQFNTPTNFSVTTGSGRSKGKYTIEIKPK
ncbi:hypothetical protein EDC18_103207 [Natranaerovirga pectinivora]|uniref:Uncharacterized protein n=1 Tax=Natranaerovirga pectinivora TaxID=682400 RepID=A0A4R3MLD5_9FIRM|nr:hypothetical protein [Natranaerovirga pectinivora]TCT15502.1 hypothetical protein EDC18_103207 [Natranaerovirga pectinivora]